jgi:hypothetical protein
MQTRTRTYADIRDEILRDPTAHESLKTAIRAFDNKDLVDAYRDVRLLLWLQERRLLEHGLPCPTRSRHVYAPSPV